MKTVNSLSGGKTSSYIAANYPADYNVFALVRIEDEKCKFPDKKISAELRPELCRYRNGRGRYDNLHNARPRAIHRTKDKLGYR